MSNKDLRAERIEIDGRSVAVGDVFVDRDSRHSGRTVRVTELDAGRGRARVQVIAAPRRPGSEGRRVWLALATLLDPDRYGEISH